MNLQRRTGVRVAGRESRAWGAWAEGWALGGEGAGGGRAGGKAEGAASWAAWGVPAEGMAARVRGEAREGRGAKEEGWVGLAGCRRTGAQAGRGATAGRGEAARAGTGSRRRTCRDLHSRKGSPNKCWQEGAASSSRDGAHSACQDARGPQRSVRCRRCHRSPVCRTCQKCSPSAHGEYRQGW
jgi:hypothetical protein